MRKFLVVIFVIVSCFLQIVIHPRPIIAEETPQALQSVLKKLDDNDVTVRRKAIETILITEYRGPELVEPLTKSLQDENFHIRAGAAKILGEIRDPTAVDPLVGVLNDDYMEVRLSAVRALGLIGDPQAIDPLIASLQDTQSEVVREAISALQYYKDDRAVEPLAQLAIESDEFLTRSAAIRAISEIGSPKAVDPLIQALGKEKDIWIKLDIVTTLGTLGDPKAIPAIKQTIQEFDQQLATEIPEDNKAIYRDIINQMNATLVKLEKAQTGGPPTEVVTTEIITETVTPTPVPATPAPSTPPPPPPAVEPTPEISTTAPAFEKVDINELQYTIQVASFKDIELAKKSLDSLSRKTNNVYLEKADLGPKGIWYRIRIGKFDSREIAESYANKLKRKGIISTYIVTKR